jgi:photosystem II stability/assembly factor-like uncharacterized protein/TolA-binding protein
MRSVFAVPAVASGLLWIAILAGPARAAVPPSFDDAALHAVQFVDDREGWAAGDDGVLWHTGDGGKQWDRVPSGVRGSLRSICFLNPYVGFVAGREELPGGVSGGVLLYTEDAGEHWRRVLLNALPGLNVVRFVDDKTGYLAGDSAGQYPSGLFVTTDSGESWKPVVGPSAAPWLAADVAKDKDGGRLALAGAWAGLASVRGDRVFRADQRETEVLGGRDVQGVYLHGADGLAVGPGGLVIRIHVEADGSRWKPTDVGLPKELLYVWDFRAVHGAGRHAWAVGRPGSTVLHTADDGAHWEIQKTGQPLPLNGVFFTDETHGWAVGELGLILATADGGKTWKVQRRGGQRAAVLCVHGRGAGTPLDAVSLLGAQDGYLTASLQIASADPASAAPARAADPARHAAAVRQAGGAAAEALWQFPVPSYLARSGRDDLLKSWDQLHDGHASEQLVRQMTLALRMWRPEVVLTDAPDGANSSDALTSEAMKAAFQAAADPKAFPEQLTGLGLETWKAAKLYGRCEGKTEGQIALELSEISPALEAAPREFAAEAAECLGDDAPLPPATRSYKLLADHRDGAASHRALMQGIELAAGGLARRRMSAAPELPPKALKAARQRAALLALADSPPGGLTDPDRLLSRIGPMLADMTDDQAGRTAFTVARQFARQGQWPLAREAFLLMVDRYPAHPLTPEAFRWLVRHNTSSEARRRQELGQFLVVSNLEFGRQAPGNTPVVSKDMPAADNLPGEVRVTRQELTFADKAQTRKWHQGALEIEPRLAAFGPLFADDPGVQLCLQAARRSLGKGDEAHKWYADFVERQADGPWRAAAEAELWLAGHGRAAPKPTASCAAVDHKPFLDGKLDDDCWKDAPVLKLRDAAGATAADCPTEVRLAHDRDFLYIAVRCARPADRAEAPAATRSHDADLSGHDRVSLLLDLDRDYATCFHFQIDERGCIADDCWGDKTWDPRWFVAVHHEDAAWVAEIAIPLASLSGDAPAPGTAWACNVVRTLPGRGVQAWSLPAEAPDVVLRPEGMGLLLFTKESKDAAAALPLPR